MPIWSSIFFQDRLSPLIEQLLFFHDHAITVLVFITVLTLYLILCPVLSYPYNKFILEGQEIETVWTIFPAIILVFIALPSLKTLYILDENLSPLVTVKVVGHQWYWSYEYSDFPNLGFDSFLGNTSNFRLLSVRDRLVAPTGVPLRALIRSEDVIHSWALPSLGLKVDALPGRVNQLNFFVFRRGLLVGQCSEICGANHSFIPILLEVVPVRLYLHVIKYFN